MTTRADMCRTCNRGLHSYNIPSREADRKEMYTFVKSPRAILHIQKKYRNPPTHRRHRPFKERVLYGKCKTKVSCTIQKKRKDKFAGKV
ncbi:hypothetical protein QLX08_009507 [Tetragonisca angustula]|uniref:Uncharacterized protein n=1 Tax=Tetragonisca angustula TaxID=166442 RepID=A0AAW0ZI88_9HYME